MLGEEMRMNLKVPFAEKEEAKKLGARWDAARKIWYVGNNADLSLFSKWSPVPHDDSVVAPQLKMSLAKKQQASGQVIVGSAFVKQERQCDCLPWDVCEKCAPMALKNNS